MLTPLRILGLALVCLAAGCGGTPLSSHARGEAGAITWRNTVHVDVDWSRIDRLIEEQKLEEASREVREILARVRGAGDEEQWTRALIKEVQLRTSLHGYETAVRFLKEEKWPEGLLARTTLELFYAHGLVTYLRSYSWEIRQRERVESRGAVDLKAWTADQIWAEALGAYERVWEHRVELDGTPVGVLKEYVTPNNYPSEVRGTLRDAVSYLSVELLSDSSSWGAEQASAAERIELGPLLEGNPVPGTLRLDAPALHPLAKVVAVLDDLERWHMAAGDKAAMLEARLERLRRLRDQFGDQEERGIIRQRLETLLPGYRREPWWSMGMLLLAELVRDEGDLVRAAQLADEGHKAFPNSPGGRRCDHLAQVIRAPDARFTTMSADAVGKRSIEVTHKNLGALHFRAYAVDLLARIAKARDYNLLPDHQEFKSLLASAQPVASWTVTLPATPDYRAHRTFVTPPMTKPGLYAIFASTEPSFALEGNRLLAQNLVLGDVVLQTSVDNSGEATVTTLSGASGRPLAGVEVSLYQYDYQRGHHVVATQKSDANGETRWGGRVRGGNNFFVVARRGAEVALDSTPLSPWSAPGGTENRASLVYTDRSIYRPEQTLHWKAIAYQGQPGRLATVPGARLTVTLYDANNQKVADQTVTTNAHGSAAGEFVLPGGRLLGEWRLATEPFSGSASVRVEEYKRPTFEVTIKEPEQGLRINRPATVTGEARYYFGLPVASGAVRWRVARQLLRPWWWGFWYGTEEAGQERVLASGTAPLQADGSFKVSFTPAADEREARRPGVSYRYLVTAQLTDEGGETRSGERSFRLGLVSVEAQIARPTSFFTAGQPAELTITRTNLDGLARPGKGSWRLVSLAQPQVTPLPAELPVKPAKLPGAPEEETTGGPDKKRYETPGDRLRARWATDYDLEQVMAGWADGKEAGRGELVHDQKGLAKLALSALAPGAYRLHYQTVDDFGASYETWKDLMVVGAAGQATPLALPALLMTEKSAAKVGERARLLVHSGLPDALLILDRYRDGRLVERRRIDSSQSGVIELPVEEGDRGGFGLVLTALRDHQHMQLQTNVFVPWDDKELKVEFASFRDRLRPGGKETWRVVVKGPGGKAEAGAAELLAYMYDRSLDVFAPHQAPSVASLYPGRTGTGWVRTNLGSSGAQWMATGDWVKLPEVAQLTGDQLNFPSGYGIGGLGGGGFGRGGGVMRMAMSAPGGPPPPAPPPPPTGSVAKGEEGLLAQATTTAGVKTEAALDKDAEKSRSSGREPAKGPPEVRSNFAETAFWKPQLLTDGEGQAVIEFTVPDSVTSWRVWVHAVTRDLRGGSLEAEAKSVKDLLVRPYLPRFLREGDEAQLKVVVNNASEHEFKGRLTLEIFDPAEDPKKGPSLLASFGVKESAMPFTVVPGGGATLTFPLTAPRKVGLVAFRVIGQAGSESDGELRPLPILPGRVHLAQSRFVTLRDADRRTIEFPDLARKDDPTRENEQLVVTVDAQLFYTMLKALPYLVEYPYECTEQTLNRFVSTGIVSSLMKSYPAVAKMAAEMSKRSTQFETFDAPDPNRKMALEETPWLEEAQGGRKSDPSLALIKVLDPQVALAQRDLALAKLRELQTSIGGFPWFPGGPPSPYMTLYLMYGFAKAAEFGVPLDRGMVERGWQYLARHFREDYAARMEKDEASWQWLTFLNYVASAYPDPSWMGDALSKDERGRILDYSFKHWKEHSPYLKAFLSLTLLRMGRGDDGRKVFASVMDSAKTLPDQGTFWAPEDRAWLWYNDTIESHAMALRTLMELSSKDPRKDGLVLWLFLNKKLNHWKSTRATAEVLYSLARYLKGEGTLGIREEVNVQLGDLKSTFVFQPDKYVGKAQVVVAGAQIEPAKMSSIVVDKPTRGVAFASATWHFSTDQLPAEGHGDLFQVSRRYFRRELKGKEWVLAPLAEGAMLAPGDQIEVQLSLTTRHAAEYVHLRDPRAAGFEPESTVSRYHWDLGIAWYEEIRDSGANFFFEQLPAGEYTFKYRLRANLVGAFRVGPATVQSMYAPEFVAYSAGHRLTIKNP